MVATTQKANERVVVERHHLGFRFLHWAIVGAAALLMITGIQISGAYGNLSLVSAIRATHVVIGEAWICIAFSFLYYFIVSGDYKWYWLSRIPLSLRFFVKEAKAWLGIGSHVDEPVLYDFEKKDYVEKIVPTEVIVWWVYFLIGVVFLLTGLAKVYPEYTGFVYTIVDWLSPYFGGVKGYAAIRAIHRLNFYILTAVAVMHAYAAVIFHMLRSVVFGDRSEPVKK